MLDTKDSVNDQVSIPKPIITTEFLNFGEVERMMYDSLTDNSKKIQLCTHLQNMNSHLSILEIIGDGNGNLVPGFKLPQLRQSFQLMSLISWFN